MEKKNPPKQLTSSTPLPPTKNSTDLSKNIPSQPNIPYPLNPPKILQKNSQALRSLGHLSNNEEDTYTLNDYGILLLQSRKIMQKTPKIQGSFELISSPKDKIQSSQQPQPTGLSQSTAQLFQQFVPITHTGQSQSHLQQSDDNFQSLAGVLNIQSIQSIQDFLSFDNDVADHHLKMHKHHDFLGLLGPSISSQQFFEQKDEQVKCQNCRALQLKAENFQNENGQYVNKIQILKKKCQILQKRSSSPLRLQIPQTDEDLQETIKAESLNDELKQNIKNLQLTVEEVKTPGFSEVLDFELAERQSVRQLIKDLKRILFIIQQGKDLNEDQDERCIKLLHRKYQQIIRDIKYAHQQKIEKLEEDFLKFMTTLKLHPDKLVSLKKPPKVVQETERVRKRMNSCWIDSINEVPKLDVSHLNDRITYLQYISLQEKKKIRILQKQNKHLIQKYTQQIQDLKDQKTYYASIVQKYKYQFNVFMQKACNNLGNNKYDHQEFFNQISDRIFEISNSIPFEDNDDQNLFAPQTDDELFEMIQRIRRFSLKVDMYYAEKDREFFNFKKGITVFIQRLLESQKISITNALKLIKESPDLQLDYLKEYLVCIKNKKLKSEQGSELNRSQSLNYQKTDYISLSSDLGQKSKLAEYH